MEDNRLQERILTYLDGNMTLEEAHRFEQELKQNPILQQEVDQMLRSKAAVFQHGKQAYKEQLLKEWDSWEMTQKSRRIPLWQRISIAASIALLIGLGIYFFKPSSQATPEELFAMHYEHPEASSIRELSNSDSILILANHSYIQGDFNKAVQLYEALLQSPTQASDEVHFYLGISYLRENRADAAIEQFSHLASARFQASGQWYHILALLQQGRVEQVKQACQVLLQTGKHPYQKQVKELLEDLE